MLILVIIRIRSKWNDQIVKSNATLKKLGGKTYITEVNASRLCIAERHLNRWVKETKNGQASETEL